MTSKRKKMLLQQAYNRAKHHPDVYGGRTTLQEKQHKIFEAMVAEEKKKNECCPVCHVSFALGACRCIGGWL